MAVGGGQYFVQITREWRCYCSECSNPTSNAEFTIISSRNYTIKSCSLHPTVSQPVTHSFSCNLLRCPMQNCSVLKPSTTTHGQFNIKWTNLQRSLHPQSTCESRENCSPNANNWLLIEGWHCIDRIQLIWRERSGAKSAPMFQERSMIITLINYHELLGQLPYNVHPAYWFNAGHQYKLHYKTFHVLVVSWDTRTSPC